MGEKKPVFFKFRSCNLYVLVTVSISAFTDMMVYTIIVPIMPFIIDSIHEGKPLLNSPAADISHSKIKDGDAASKDTGILLALFSTGLLVGSPTLGYLADRIQHRRWPMITGIAGLLGATLLFLFASSYWQLLLARFLQGFSDACIWTLGMCLITDTFSIEELGTQMGKVLSFHSLGLVCGGPTGALYKFGGYKAPFILCIVLAGIDLLLRIFLVERKHRPIEWLEEEKKNLNTSVVAVAPSKEIRRRDEKEVIKKKNVVTTLQLLRQQRLLAGMLLGFTNGVVCNIFEPTLPVWLSQEWGYDTSQVGLVFLAQVVPTIIGNPLSGFISDRYGPKVVCCTGLTLCAVAILFAGVPRSNTAGGIIPLIVIFITEGFAASFFVTPALSEMARVIRSLNPDGGDSGQGMSYALFNIAYALGGLLGPLISGYLYSSVGFFYTSIIFGSFLLLCVPYIFVFTGGRGKFIIRPQDRQKVNADEEQVNSSSISRDSDSSTDCSSDSPSTSDSNNNNQNYFNTNNNNNANEKTIIKK